MAPRPFTAILLIVMGAMITSLQTFGQQELDKAHYKFYYEVGKDIMILQIGQNVSKSYSYNTFQVDSLRATPDGRKVFRESLNQAIIEGMAKGERPKFPYHSGMKTIVYKNYPEGQMTVTDNILLNHYRYSDEMHSQDWEITDSTKTILNDTCQMAVSDFRGRRWTAWYAPDIPISDGPWKFSGLPGLIMEVYDTENHYHFTMVAIESVADEPIVFSPVILSPTTRGKYEETTRLDFLRAKDRFSRNQNSYMNAELGKDTFDESSAGTTLRDPIERDSK